MRLTSRFKLVTLATVSYMFLYVSIFALTIALYIIVRAILPLRAHWVAKATLALLTLTAAGKFHLLYLIEGENFFTPALPAWVVWGGCWLFCAVAGYALVLLVADIIRIPLYLVLWLVRRRPADTWRQINNCFNLSLLLLMLALTGWGTWCGIKAPECPPISIPIAGMPSEASPIRMVHLSDLHADSTKGSDFYRDIVQRVNKEAPDIVVITGDFADGTVADCGEALAPLRELDAPMGVYAVTGNHDYFWGTKAWLRYLESLGIEFIDGRCVQLCVEMEGGIRKELSLIGLHDPMVKRTGQQVPTLGELVPPRGDSQRQFPTVLLSHQPRTATNAAKYDIDLQLSGHTHGGQFPGLQQIVANMNGGYVYGHYTIGDMQLYVSPGTSLWTPVCLRLGVPAEITVINLYPPDKK